MATITRKIDSVIVTIADGTIVGTSAVEVNFFPQDDVVRIAGVDYILSTLIMGGGVIGSAPTLVGTFGFADINALPASASVTHTIPNAKPAGKYALKAWLKIIAPFVSATRAINTLSGGLSNETAIPAGTAGDYIRFGSLWCPPGVADGTIDIDFFGGGVNPRDFSAGSGKLYLELIDAATLS